MCDPIGGQSAHHFAVATESAATHQVGPTAGNNPNWLEEAEKIQTPALMAPQQEWFDYAEKLAGVADVPSGLVTDMIKSKGSANALGGHSAGDGTGEQVFGPLSVHGGLLEGGIYAETTHGLKNAEGAALTPEDMRDPAKAMLAGIQHLKQLVEHYGGDTTKAINHYETGEANNSQHALSHWCEGSSCSEQPASQNHGAHHGLHTPHTQASHGADHHGMTGLGVGQSLGEYITPDSTTASQHIGEGHGMGFLMHRATHDAAIETVFKKPASEVLSSVQSTLENTGTYLGNKTDTEKIKGAYLTANMLMKQGMLPATLFGSEKDAGSTYAQAKLKAIDGDVTGLRKLIESKGGSTFGLKADQLLNVWATNEHNNLHSALDAGSPIGQTIHMTSLNDKAQDGTAKGKLGGYNDRGEYPQWNWFEDAKSVGHLFTDLQTHRHTA